MVFAILTVACQRRVSSDTGSGFDEPLVVHGW